MNNYINIHYKIHRLFKYTHIPTNTQKKIEPQESLFFNPGHFKVPALSFYTFFRPSKKNRSIPDFPA